MRYLALTILLVIVAGCASNTTLYVIEQEDIIPVKEGETLTAPKDGFFLSKFYVQECMDAEVQ